jgi:pimeloyl-ACP methyl ester carboxylesterase
MPVVSANGIKIAYDDRGGVNDPVILLIMGLATQMIAWPEAFCNGLAARGFRVIRFDNRDVGLSTKFDSAPPIDLAAIMQSAAAGRKISTPYDLTDMAKDAVGLMDRLSIGKAHVVGASMGGMIAQIVAGQYPKRVHSLVSRVEMLKRISVPTLVLHGADDPLVPVEAGRHTAAQIPGSKLTIIPGMGHDIPTGLIPTLVDAIAAHCKAVDQKSKSAGVAGETE